MKNVKLDKDRILFQSKLYSMANRFGASVEGDDAEDFVNLTYEQYIAAGKPNNLVSWLRERLGDAFLSVNESPVWVEAEPSWAFYDGRPMVFITQSELLENEVTRNVLGYGQVLYLFGIRVPTPCGDFTLEYKTVTQIRGF